MCRTARIWVGVIKSDKKKAVEAYFNELCVSESIDFISFETLEIEPNLSTTEKKYKEQVYEYISKVNDDLKLIKTTDFEAEILTEYKTSLNVAEAITKVKTRKEEEAKEKARLKARETQKRKSELEALGMQFIDITNAYEYNFNPDIYIDTKDIENLSPEDFIAKVSECEVKINAIKSEALNKEASATENTPVEKHSSNGSVADPVVAPVAAPTIEKKPEPLKTASFEVTATMPQLRALGAYMKANNITYKGK